MKKKLAILLGISHLLVGLFGFALGIYVLPILIAPPSPTAAEVERVSTSARYTAEFTRDLEGSDAFHWGEGQVSLSDQQIALMGSVSPGPDFRLYLSPTFVETEAAFEQAKASMIQVGMVHTFENFLVELPTDVDISAYNTVIVWCERFGEFITSAQYR